jgi:hypothetical protein
MLSYLKQNWKFFFVLLRILFVVLSYFGFFIPIAECSGGGPESYFFKRVFFKMGASFGRGSRAIKKLDEKIIVSNSEELHEGIGWVLSRKKKESSVLLSAKTIYSQENKEQYISTTGYTGFSPKNFEVVPMNKGDFKGLTPDLDVRLGELIKTKDFNSKVIDLEDFFNN